MNPTRSNNCILTSLELSNRCPKCSGQVDQIFPNYLLNELVLKHQRKLAEDRELELSDKNLLTVRNYLDERSNRLDARELSLLIDRLSKRRQQVEQNCRTIQCELLGEFLGRVRQHKRDQLVDLATEVDLIQNDKARVEQQLAACARPASAEPAQRATGSAEVEPSAELCNQQMPDRPSPEPTLGEQVARIEARLATEQAIKSASDKEFAGSPSTAAVGDPLLSSTYLGRRRKMLSNFEALEQLYFSTRANASQWLAASSADYYESLDEFKETLNRFTMYSRFRPLASLCYTSDTHGGSSIVSSIEFDRDNELFAIAGVTKKIKLFDYRTVIKDEIGVMHYPISEMVCGSKISCISWSSYYKNMVASSDYEGIVTIWDPLANQCVKQFQEHAKRCWSVDFNKVDTKLLASGSDDSKVKLWSVNMSKSVATLETKSNVCCVKFNPTSRYHIAFGSVDHHVHYYDLRNNKSPLLVFKGHRKPVSYVRFLNASELVSASTDSQLKLWNTENAGCQRSFKGHQNEKNFVGLAADPQFLICGSENNALYAYYKGFSKPSLSYSFDGKETPPVRSFEVSESNWIHFGAHSSTCQIQSDHPPSLPPAEPAGPGTTAGGERRLRELRLLEVRQQRDRSGEQPGHDPGKFL